VLATGPHRSGTWGRIAGVLAAWAVLLAAVAFELYPAIPEGRRGWTLLVVLGPPIYVALELLAAKVWSHEWGVRISFATFSWKRVLIALVVCLALAAAAGVAVRM
jgi:hypothetical protein